MEDQFHFTPQLLNYLQLKKLETNREFFSFLAGANEEELLPFIKLTKDNLHPRYTFELGENRFFDEKVIIENSIVDCDTLHFSNNREVTLVNCIFTGNVFFSERARGFLNSVYIDNCIFMGKLQVNGCNDLEKFIICKTNVYQLNCINSKIKTIDITFSRVFFTNIEENRINEFYTNVNEFSYMGILGNNFTKVDFDFEQFQVENLNRSKQKLKEHVDDYNLFQLNNKTSRDILNSNNNEEVVGTINFLRNHTKISSNRFRYNVLLYLESVIYQPNSISKILMRIFGGFIKPSRFIWLALGTYLFFALIYTLPFMQFTNYEGGLDFSEALYFSGVTFTTIGYGDITPKSFTRVAVIIEGICGIITLSAYVVSLVRRYID
ncbi:potassium channel family protein [Paenibacillus sp. OK003]|uniref:potassium channel family protein n=1 Tax=Paenibacillus sp. OK003 TaxID=1884380 RepID=UPI0008CC41C8|nr:potassium channel family protein [Paenibacillus sp. OK003]SEL81372.1 Ion channel [Paenibacillus sp. OK003]